MLNSNPSYVRLPEGKKQVYDEYGPETDFRKLAQEAPQIPRLEGI